MKNRSIIILGLVLGVTLTACDSDSDSVNAGADVAVQGNSAALSSELQSMLDSIPPGEISPEERAGLLFMREEEKLAHDVYVTLFEQWGRKIFQNISNAELTHTDAVLALLERYAIPDPVGTHGIGVFTDPDLQGLYDSLVATGGASLIDALQVGAAIEEIDILDIEVRQEDIIENEDIDNVYEMLLKGSRNHLRAFVKNLVNQGVNYEPQYLPQSEYDAIINSPTERGRKLVF